MGSPPTGYSPLWTATTCPSHTLQFSKSGSTMGSFHGQTFRNRLLQNGSLMDHNSSKKRQFCVGFSPQSVFSSGSPIQSGLTRVCSFLQATSMCCSMDSSLSWSVDIFSDMVLQGLQADNLPMVTSTGYRGISAPVLEASPSPPISLTWYPWGCFIFFSFTSFTDTTMWFLPFIRSVFMEVPLTLLIGSASASSGYNLEPGGIPLVQDRLSSHRGHFCSPPCYQNLIA